ncbi:hypothetical protein V2A60_002265 [Cordyceps javanica]
MSYAVAKPQASSPAGKDGPPSTATVYDFICLFTHDLRRKQKRWQDGKLKYHSFNKKVMVYDDRGHFVGDAHWDQEGDLAPGDELSLDRGMALVQVEDCTGEKQQDLTELLDKRAREVEKRRQIAAAKTRPTPRSSLAGGQQPQGAQQRPHLPLSSLVQSPGPIGRAAIPAHSPFEARQGKLHQNKPPTADAQPTVAERPPPARKQRVSPSPPSKAGFARNLFGTTLNLSACPGPELMAARARALRQRMLSQVGASSTPLEDEETEDPEPVQSSPLFLQDDEEVGRCRPAKKQRPTLQPVTRHPIASARSVMVEAENAVNRSTESAIGDEDVSQEENILNNQRKEQRKQHDQTAEKSHRTQDRDRDEDSPTIILEKTSKRKRKDRETSQFLQSRRAEAEEIQRKQPSATRYSPLPDLMMVNEPNEIEDAQRQRRTSKESRSKKEDRERTATNPSVPVRAEPESKELRTTLRMRSRQKRGLLVMREPIVQLPKPTSAEEERDDRIEKTPSPEPSTPPTQPIRSASPEEITIPSSAAPEDGLETNPEERIPTPVLPESSSEDEIPQKSQRRTKKRRTYSPSPELEVSEKISKKRKQRDSTKGNVHEEKASEEEDEPRPRRRRAAKRRAYSEESESEHNKAEQEEEAPELQGPRIKKLPRKGIRSREIIGYVPQGIDALIPGPFASASFRLGGPPVPAVVSEAPRKPLTAEASSNSKAALETAENRTEETPGEEEPVAEQLVVMEDPAASPQDESPTTAIRLPDPVLESMSEPVIEPVVPPVPHRVQLPVSPRVVAGSPEADEAISPKLIPRRTIAPKAPAPVVRCNSSSKAITPTTAEPNETKLEALSAPEVALAKIPLQSDAQTSGNLELETKPEMIAKPPATVLTGALSTSESMSSGSETNQTTRPRIANPASRGKKAARREDAAGLAPQVMVPFEPVQPVARMISTRPAGLGGAGRGRIAAAGPLAMGPVAPPPPPPPLPSATGAPVVAKKAASMPGFTSASGGTWSRHAHDLLGMERPERGR